MGAAAAAPLRQRPPRAASAAQGAAALFGGVPPAPAPALDVGPHTPSADGGLALTGLSPAELDVGMADLAEGDSGGDGDDGDGGDDLGEASPGEDAAADEEGEPPEAMAAAAGSTPAVFAPVRLSGADIDVEEVYASPGMALRCLNDEATWVLSSAKPGCALPELLDDDVSVSGAVDAR